MTLTAVREWFTGFLKHERRTAPRLLPMWAIALVILAGYQPGSTAWLYSTVAALLLGVVVVPLVGSIAPTYTAYLTLLTLVVGMIVVSAVLPLHEWYDKAWLDQAPTGAVAMIVFGAAVVGGFTSVLWAGVVLAETTRRLIRKFRTGSALPPDASVQSGPVAVVPGARRPRRWLRRVYVAMVCLALALPLPSFFVMSGLFVRPMAGPHRGIGGFLGDLTTALTWPLLTTLWLLTGAVMAWLLESRAIFKTWWALGALVALSLVVVIVVVADPTFAMVPGPQAPGFAPSVLDYCPTGARACEPAWLYSLPWVVEVTEAVRAWIVAGNLTATAVAAGLVWRRRRAA